MALWAVINCWSIRDEEREREKDEERDRERGHRDIERGERQKETERGASAFELAAAPCSGKLRCDCDFYLTSRIFTIPFMLARAWELDFPARDLSTEAVYWTGILRIYKSSPESAMSSSSPDRDWTHQHPEQRPQAFQHPGQRPQAFQHPGQRWRDHRRWAPGVKQRF